MFERPAKNIPFTVDAAPILAVVAYSEPVFSWILLTAIERTAGKSIKPSPVPTCSESTTSEEIVA